MSKVRFNKQKNPLSIKDEETVTVTQMQHIIEVIYVARTPNTLDEYKKIDKEHFAHIDRDTGEILEIKEYYTNENRAQNTAGLKQTMKNLRNLINNNFTGAPNELFITLTYRPVDGKPMNDVGKASRDFDIFIKRFRRKYSDLEYIAVLEPQANTAWHNLRRKSMTRATIQGQIGDAGRTSQKRLRCATAMSARMASSRCTCACARHPAYPAR